jgi:hypothetical protein
MSALSEDREVERFARPEPDDVRGVIGKIISGLGVSEDGEAEAIEHSPCGKLTKALLGDGELTAPTRVRPDRVLMEMPNRHLEQGARLASECSSGAQFIGFKIDVSVEVSKFVHSAEDRLFSPEIKSWSRHGVCVSRPCGGSNRS